MRYREIGWFPPWNDVDVGPMFALPKRWRRSTGRYLLHGFHIRVISGSAAAGDRVQRHVSILYELESLLAPAKFTCRTAATYVVPLPCCGLYTPGCSTMRLNTLLLGPATRKRGLIQWLVTCPTSVSRTVAYRSRPLTGGHCHSRVKSTFRLHQAENQGFLRDADEPSSCLHLVISGAETGTT